MIWSLLNQTINNPQITLKPHQPINTLCMSKLMQSDIAELVELK